MNEYLQRLEPFILQGKQIGSQIYRNEYFQYITIFITIITFFFLGRLSYEKKLTNLLEMVNDAQATRKNLKIQLQKKQKIQEKLKSKRKILWILSGLVIAGNAGYLYFKKKIVWQIIVYTFVPLLIIWIAFGIIIRWTKWSKKSVEQRIKNTSFTAQVQIKQILKIFGQGLKNRLKALYQSDIESQWARQAKQQCKLYKCYNEKKCYDDLYKLYEQIINEIKKINMCDICLTKNNISVQKLGLSDLENTIKNFKKIKSGKMSLAQKKQMVNRLLSQYQKMIDKLPNICRKGCCIRQRVLIQNAKSKYHERLKKLTAQLNEKK